MSSGESFGVYIMSIWVKIKCCKESTIYLFAVGPLKNHDSMFGKITIVAI